MIGWAYTAQGQNPSIELSKRDDKQMMMEDRQSQAHPATRDLAKHVRSAISRDKSFSGYAHKVVVIPSVYGTVTLKGRVRSDEEKHLVEAKAAEVAGAGNINTELFVADNTAIDRSK